GLAISRGLVDLHLGKIWAHSAGLGRGARFVVELPLLPAGASSKTQPRPRQAARILLVEDNTDMSAALSIALGQHGYRVNAVNTAAAALEQEMERFDLVVSDLGLPDGNGHDLLRALRRGSPVRAI